MKLASLKNDSRDGLLVVVNKSLSKCVAVPEIAQSLQEALDNWARTESQLNEVYIALNSGELSSEMPFSTVQCESPLPRSYQWADGSAYVNHVELVRKARGAEMPPSFWTDPLMYQGGSDSFIGPCDPIPLSSEEWGIDFEGEVAVITGDVSMGVSASEAEKSIRLIMLVNDVSLRGLIPP